MIEPGIDVIIPTYNRSHVLKRSVSSVLKQTYKNYNLIIVDDGSTDETLKLLEEIQSHPQVTIIQQANLGVSSARNRGISSSTSEWISFLDSDDEWLPHKLEAQVSFLNQHPEFDFLHSEEQWFRKGVRVNPKVKHKKSGDDLFVRSLEFCLISPSTVMMKRSLFHKHGPFGEEFTVCEDFDLWNKILAFEKVGFIDEALVKKFGGEEDQLSTKFVAMDYFRIKSLVNLYQHPNLKTESKDLIREIILKKSDILLKGYLKHQNLIQSEELKKALQKINISINL